MDGDLGDGGGDDDGDDDDGGGDDDDDGTSGDDDDGTNDVRLAFIMSRSAFLVDILCPIDSSAFNVERSSR